MAGCGGEMAEERQQERGRMQRGQAGEAPSRCPGIFRRCAEASKADRERLLQLEHVFHVVQAGRLAGDPARRTQSPLREDLARAGAVRKLDALAIAQ